ncbi:chemotaxis protein CheA [Variovorax ginsengisoli]|uniref:Chemotaxis protein CheA n=1 Tax=Variovorax ginsengisoli TaxID=363844 RepID=A0ABT9SC27_9BURK|nr:chemotaxis protein CheA [Variovorax ginsengisoli]MDP9900947.1 two-component system chemotaxis sensor kinase CheA [Variovorax ginsengisoli]
MNMDEALQTFFVECRELLEDMDTALLGVLQEEDPSDSINAIFRAAHTIKGSAGLFGLDFIVEFAHVAESVLDKVRAGALPLDDDMVTLLLACGDHVGSLVDGAAAGHTEADEDMNARGAPLLVELHRHLGTAPAQAPVAAPQTVATAAGAGADPAHWHISLRFGTEVLRNGMDPLSFVRYLNKLGTVTAIVTVFDALPALAEMDAESCYLGFELALRSSADRAAIEGAFEFVQDDCTVRIVPPGSPVAAYLDLLGTDGAREMGEMLVHCRSLTQAALDVALTGTVAAAPSAGEPVAAPLAPDADVPATSEAAAPRQRTPKDAKVGETQSVRVDADKLDRLVDLVGELITASATASVAGRHLQSTTLHEAHSTLMGLVQEVRDSALQLRMVKIGATFNRFKRVVHDVSREIGKDIALEIYGEDTELDKTVVEKIADPLTHLVRNSMDHGIENAALRAERGKPARGTVTLNAYHDSGSIVIEVSDDGGGLSRDRILAKAVERGLVEPGKQLSDPEIYGLIFEPGFSTAEQVTNLSGRGVGMDVVKRNITALRGVVSVDSKPGEGATVTVRLPLTLAIINGFQVTVGNAVFVLPLDVIEECVEFAAETGHDYAELRGQVLPFIRLRELFKVAGAPSARQSIVVVKQGAQRFGLIVDRLLGEAQTVIKPMAPMFAHLEGISGSSILGSGEVALILDVPMLLRQTLNAKPADRPGALSPS